MVASEGKDLRDVTVSSLLCRDFKLAANKNVATV